MTFWQMPDNILMTTARWFGLNFIDNNDNKNYEAAQSNLQTPFLSKIQNPIIEKTGEKILLLYGKISR